MNISPINFVNFGRKATPAEIKKLQQDLRKEKHNYRKLEDNYICQTPEGFSALGKALHAAKGYAHIHTTGEMRIIEECLEHSSDEQTLAECSENLKKIGEAKRERTKKLQEGLLLFFESHPKEKEIISKAKQQFSTTEAGLAAAKKLNTAQERYIRAKKGDDIEDILGKEQP